MPETAQWLADRLHLEGRRVVEFFNQLTDDQWDIKIYPPDSEWNFHHLIAHFVSSEMGRTGLIREICGGGSGAAPDFSIDAFNRSEVESLVVNPREVLLIQFSTLRHGLVETVSTLTEHDLLKTGADPYLGQTSLAEMIKLTYRHLQVHLREARRVL